jgi:hypothetical protein
MYLATGQRTMGAIEELNVKAIRDNISSSLNAASAELFCNGYFEDLPEMCLILWPISGRWSVIVRGNTGLTRNLVLELPLDSLELVNRMIDHRALVQDIAKKIEAVDGDNAELADLAASHSASLIKLLR